MLTGSRKEPGSVGTLETVFTITRMKTPQHAKTIKDKRPKLIKSPPMQYPSSGSLSPQFQRTYSSLTTGNPLITECACVHGSNSIVSIPSMVTNHRDAIKKRANRQKQEILNWLSQENPRPLELLQKLSTCSTEYAKLLKMTAEELEHEVRLKIVDHSAELEKDAAIRTVKVEVQCQQLQDKLGRLKDSSEKLQEKLQQQKKILEQKNKEIDGLRSLAEQHGVDEDWNRQRRTFRPCNSAEPEKEQKEEEPPEPEMKRCCYDQVQYHQLWDEGVALEKTLDQLTRELRQKQAFQMEAVAEWGRKNMRPKRNCV